MCFSCFKFLCYFLTYPVELDLFYKNLYNSLLIDWLILCGIVYATRLLRLNRCHLCHLRGVYLCQSKVPEILREFLPPTTCHVLCVTWHMYFFFFFIYLFFTKFWSYSVKCVLFTEPTLSSIYLACLSNGPTIAQRVLKNEVISKKVKWMNKFLHNH